MKFQAMVNFKDTFGNFEFLIPLPTTKDTIWLNDQSHYTYSTSNLIGDIYTINNQSSNYVLFETNSAEFNSSNGIFQAQFIIDTLAGRIDTLSPDTVSLKNGLFSGSYLK